MFKSEEFFIKYNVISNHEKNLSFFVDNGELKFSVCEEVPNNYKPVAIKGDFISEVIKMIVAEGRAILNFKWNQVIIYKSSKILLMFQEIKYLGMNKKKTPIVEIEGERYSGYGQISYALFGYYRTDIKEIMKPYLVRDFDPEKLAFLHYNNYRGKSYPVFKYDKETKIKGKNGLRREFPQLTNEQLDKIIRDIEPPKYRHEYLKEKFNIIRIPNSSGGFLYNMVIPGAKDDINVETKSKVMEIIRNSGESISQDTAKKLFESF